MSTTEQSVSRQSHPVQAAIHTAIARLAGLKPTRIVGEPGSADAHGLVDDLLAVATIVDPIVAAIGDYADSTIGIPPDDRLLFAGQLRAGPRRQCHLRGHARDRATHRVPQR